MDAVIFTREFFVIVALGGLLAIDDRAGWQGLFAQPIFVAMAVGTVVGAVEHAILVGLALELVWLAILPMRGARRPDSVAGAAVGAGTACILIQKTGDPRALFLVAVSALVGLVVGEAAGVVTRAVGRWRAVRLGNFEPPTEGNVRTISRRLDAYQTASLGYIFALEAAMIAVALPLSLLGVEAFTGLVDEPFATGARWWLDLLPVLGAAAMIQHYWHRHSNRFLAVAAVVFLVILWIR